MITKQEISRAVKSTAPTLREEEIFASPSFYEMMQDVITACTYNLNRTPRIDAFCDENDNTTAYTDGCTVGINTLGPLIRRLPTPWKKYLSNFGHITHECGHVLFTDFTEANPRIRSWAIGEFKFIPEQPKVDGIDVDEIVQYLNTHPNYRMIYAKHMKSLDNIMEDVYIENRLYEQFGGLCTAGLHAVNDEDYRQTQPINDELQAVVIGMTIPLTVALNIIHIEKLGYEIKIDGKLTNEQQEVYDDIRNVLNTAEPLLNELCWEADGRKRSEYLNKLFVMLMPLFPRPENNCDLSNKQEGQGQQSDQEGQGGKSNGQSCGKPGGKSNNNSGNNSSENSNSGSSGQNENGSNQNNASQNNSNQNDSNSNGNEQNNDNGSKQNQNGKNQKGNVPTKDDILDALQQLINSLSQEPKGNTKPVDKNPCDKDEVQHQKDKAEQLSKSEKSVNSELNSLKERIAKEILEAEAEDMHQAELQKEADNLMKKKNKNLANTRYSNYKVRRASKRNATSQRCSYETIRREIASTSEALSRKIKNAWKDREFESSDSGYIYGQRFNVKDVFRGDGRVFSRINTPDGKLRACFGVLVDESGSMGGDESIIARRTAILFEDILRNINVPLCIIGHTTQSSTSSIILNSYVDFDTIDDADKYRLCDINAYNSNCDGAAITYICEKMLKRPEEIKVLIVISDGAPTGVSFYSEYPIEDTKAAIKTYRKKGIKIFGSVVDQWERVSNIYGDEYSFDCREKGALEAQFIRLIKKYCVNISK